MKTAVDYTKDIATIAEKYFALVTCECGVYQIEYSDEVHIGGKIIDELRQVLPENTRFKLYPDGVIEVEINEEG
jgi:hypothetical protein